jgi:DNA-binding transcriptional LysR family regulator
MNARQLEVFRAIMRSTSMTAAAKSLNVSQPAMSKVLRHFEDQLGYALFERVNGRLLPTTEARLLFDEADRVLREIEVVRELAVRIREKRVGMLRIGASAPPTFGVLPAAIARFQARHPDVKIVLRTLPAPDLAEKIADGDVDLGLSVSALRAPALQAEVLGTTEIVAVLPKDSPLAQRRVITPADLVGYRLISYGSHADVGPLLDEAFASAGLKREVSIEVGLSVSAAPLVQAGLGIALVDGLMTWTDFAGLITRPFSPRVPMSLSLVTDSSRPSSRLVRDFAQDLRAVWRGPAITPS